MRRIKKALISVSDKSNLKPLLQEYMKQNDIKIVVDRKTVVLVENNLDISQKAIELLNGKVKTLNIK